MKALSLCVLVIAACSGPSSPGTRFAAPTAMTVGFDQDRSGDLPADWRVGSTTPSGPDSTWSVRADPDAPTKPNVLVMTSVNHGSQDTFNLCWSPKVGFLDGTIELAVKAQDGEIDQGGGVAWRVQGANDYYICRYNPLEANFRVYVVRGGIRTQLATALVTQDGGWHRIRIEHSGDHIVCSLDGSKLLDARDGTLPDIGGVGVWTKADARTAFDDLRVTPGKP